MSTPEIDQWVEYYAKLLRLQDWTIVVEVKRAHGMKPGSLGQCWAVAEQRHCTISLLDPIDFGGLDSWCADVEPTLVHELLHVVFYTLEFPEGTVQDLVLEQGINATADALVKQRRALAGLGVEIVCKVEHARLVAENARLHNEIAALNQRLGGSS